MNTHARAGTWDALIFKQASGEYGILDLKDKVVLDIGAHIGGFSALAGGLGARRVVAYEASPENYKLLVKNTRKFKNVSCSQMAVWRSDESVATLRWAPSENDKNTGGGGVFEKRADHGHVSVPAVAFDAIVQSLGEVDVLKIDCEGSEYPILMTSRKLDCIGLIVGEWHRVPHTLNGSPRAGWTPEGLFEHLRANGFVVATDTSANSDGRLGHFRAQRPELRWYERKVFSGCGEDGVIEEAFNRIVPERKFAVEFGAHNGEWLSNSRNLVVNHGWSAHLIEGRRDLATKAALLYNARSKITVDNAVVLPSNVESLFAAANVPPNLDFLSIDLDSFDWYVWHAIVNYRPKVVCIEYNASFPPPDRRVVPYDPEMFSAATARLETRNDDYFGASLQSLCDLAHEKGYELVHCTTDGVNAFFVDEKFAPLFPLPGVVDRAKSLYRLPTYGYEGKGRAPNGRGHDRSPLW